MDIDEIRITAEDFIESILDGGEDDKLAKLEEAIRERKASIANRRRFVLAPGDTVTFNDAIRPLYLVGKTATVVKVNRTTVEAECPDDSSYGRFRGETMRVPLILIEDPS